MQQFLWKHLTKCNSKNAIIMSAYLLHAYCYVPNITGIERDLTHGFFSWKKRNKIILSSYRMWEYEFQSGSTSEYNAILLLPVHTFYDSQPEFKVRAEWSRQTVPLEGLAPKDTVCLIRTWPTLDFWTAWLYPIASYKLGENRLASKRK